MHRYFCHGRVASCLIEWISGNMLIVGSLAWKKTLSDDIPLGTSGDGESTRSIATLQAVLLVEIGVQNVMYVGFTEYTNKSSLCHPTPSLSQSQTNSTDTVTKIEIAFVEATSTHSASFSFTLTHWQHARVPCPWETVLRPCMRFSTLPQPVFPTQFERLHNSFKNFVQLEHPNIFL